MKYYVKKEGMHFAVVVFDDERYVAQTGIHGQDLGTIIQQFTGGRAEQVEDLPEGISIHNGVVSWLTNESAAA